MSASQSDYYNNTQYYNVGNLCAAFSHAVTLCTQCHVGCVFITLFSYIKVVIYVRESMHVYAFCISLSILYNNIVTCD